MTIITNFLVKTFSNSPIGHGMFQKTKNDLSICTCYGYFQIVIAICTGPNILNWRRHLYLTPPWILSHPCVLIPGIVAPWRGCRSGHVWRDPLSSSEEALLAESSRLNETKSSSVALESMHRADSPVRRLDNQLNQSWRRVKFDNLRWRRFG